MAVIWKRLKYDSVSATDKVLGRETAGAGAIEEIACTAAGRALLDDASASDQATTLGLGTGNSPAFAGLTIDTDTLVVDALNNRVGIRNATPGTTLDIVGVVRAQAGAGATSNYYSISPGNSTTGSSMISATLLGVYCPVTFDASFINFNLYGSTQMSVDGSGRLGVGTITQLAKVAINGGLNVGADPDPGDNNLSVAGTATIVGAFGCNSKTAQTAYASGGALAAYGTGAFGLDSDANMSALHALVVKIRAALVANGIMS